MFHGRPLRPNLFIIGAAKSGTSALHRYLSFHPLIRMSEEKEPCFFVDQDELRAAWPIMARQPCSYDLDAYLGLFRGGENARYRGEASVFYSQAPHFSGVAERIAEAAPDARLIYLVREPVSRAIAHYWQLAKEFDEERPLTEAVAANPIFFDSSDYARQIKVYLRHFDRAQIYILTHEELKTDRRRTLDALLDWLGLPPHPFTDEQLAERHVSPERSRRARFPFVRALRNSGAWSAVRKIMPNAAIDRLRAAATEPVDKSEADAAAARALLKERLAPAIAEFEALIGRRFPEWREA